MKFEIGLIGIVSFALTIGMMPYLISRLKAARLAIFYFVDPIWKLDEIMFIE
jgi:hypothetical protein